MAVSIARSGSRYVLDASMTLPRGREEVFSFFADAGNLESITPATLRFRILTPRPIVMRVGSIIDYRLSIHGIPVRWQTEITLWDPPHRFVDEQRRGPYWRWVHEHRFREEGDATIVEDRVEYLVPGGRLVHGLFVGRDVRRIFEFRERTMSRLFGAPGGPGAAQRFSSDRRMRGSLSRSAST
jgi:ligand-binding SRPBCC domain-containing protein